MYHFWTFHYVKEIERNNKSIEAIHTEALLQIISSQLELDWNGSE